MAGLKVHKVVASLPNPLEADSVYFVRVGNGIDTYVTNSLGEIIAYPTNSEIQIIESLPVTIPTKTIAINPDNGDLFVGFDSGIKRYSSDRLVDTVPPVLSSTSQNFDIAQGTAPTFETVTATDAVDGEVEVTQSGTVDENTLGSYDITYTATDSDGNETSVVHTYNVLEATANYIDLTSNRANLIESQYLDIPNVNKETSYWVALKVIFKSQSNLATFLEWYNSTINRLKIDTFYNGSTTHKVRSTVNGSGSTVGSNLTLNTPYTIIVAVDGTTSSRYLNGVLSSASRSSSVEALSDLKIGLIYSYSASIDIEFAMAGNGTLDATAIDKITNAPNELFEGSAGNLTSSYIDVSKLKLLVNMSGTDANETNLVDGSTLTFTNYTTSIRGN